MAKGMLSVVVNDRQTTMDIIEQSDSDKDGRIALWVGIDRGKGKTVTLTVGREGPVLDISRVYNSSPADLLKNIRDALLEVVTEEMLVEEICRIVAEFVANKS